MKMRKLFVLFFVLFILLLIAFYGAYSDYIQDNKRSENLTLVQTKLKQLSYLDGIITQLQKERGLSAIYYEHKSENYQIALDSQRKKTDFYIEKARKYVDTKSIIQDRKLAIDAINEGVIKRFDSLMNYTLIISSILQQSEILITKASSPEIRNSLLFYNQLHEMQETAGQIRALAGAILTSKTISQEEYNEIVILKRDFYKYKRAIEGQIELELSFDNDNIMTAEMVIESIISTSILDNSKLESIDIEPLEWFYVATDSVNVIKESSTEEINHINETLAIYMTKAEFLSTRHTILWSLASIFMLLSLIFAIVLSRRLFFEQQLLKSYKNIIDNNPSSIVSKADKYGIITYANDNFCKLSKYTREELIGEPHHIIRHEDVKRETFKDLWSTIKSGKTWRGILKNRAKDGEPYWVDASISPIYDWKGNLVEYIAMRHNITDMILQQAEVERTQKEIIFKLGEFVESRSKENGNHIRRVAHYSKTLALLSGISEKESEVIFSASTMHDMGKIGIPDSILLKPGRLDQDEFEIMKTHSEIGYQLLWGSNLPILKMASVIAHEHHEHYDGHGYPLGIRDKDIATCSKIVAIADVFDALISKRVYKKAWDLEKVLSTIESLSGKQFDPTLVKLFLENIDKFTEIKDRFEDE